MQGRAFEATGFAWIKVEHSSYQIAVFIQDEGNVQVFFKVLHVKALVLNTEEDGLTTLKLGGILGFSFGFLFFSRSPDTYNLVACLLFYD